MRRQIFSIAILALSPAWSGASDHKQEVDVTAPIRITINPESRVSVALVGPLPPVARCGMATQFQVSIVNQGFLTAPLEANPTGDAPAGVTVFIQPDPLKGVAHETRKLPIKLTKPGLTDLTITFKAHNEIPDLGGRDRIHLLIQCHI